MGTQKIILKKSTVAGKVPLPADLEPGEVAVNTADAVLYTKDPAGTVKRIGTHIHVGTAAPADTTMLWLDTN